MQSSWWMRRISIFFGETVVDLIGKVPNLVVARTFSKAYGLAGLRLGMLAAAEETMRWLRRVISPYSVNSLALVCVKPAALADRAYRRMVCRRSEAGSSENFCRSLRCLCSVRYWPTESEFCFGTDIGAEHQAFVTAMRTRGVLTRDRSADPGCDGCVRITIGTRQQMAEGRGRHCSASLDEIGWRKKLMPKIEGCSSRK